jgi:hypothetical protein
VGLVVSVVAVALCFTLAIVTVNHDAQVEAATHKSDSSSGSNSGKSDSGKSGSGGSDSDQGDGDFASVKPTDANPIPIGSTGTYGDGLAVTVSAPTASTPSSSQSGADNPNNEIFEVTIKNGSSQSLVLQDVISATCGGTEGHRYFDSPDITLPRDPIAPGKSITYKVGFSFPTSSGSYGLDVAPAFKYDDMYFGAQ